MPAQHVLREGVELRPAPVEYVHVGGLATLDIPKTT